MSIMAGQEHDLTFRLETWSDDDARVDELVALAADFYVARAAFEEAVRRRPGRVVTLRQGARVLRDSRTTKA